MLIVSVTYRRENGESVPVVETTRPEVVRAVTLAIAGEFRRAIAAVSDPFLAAFFAVEADRAEALLEAAGIGEVVEPLGVSWPEPRRRLGMLTAVIPRQPEATA